MQRTRIFADGGEVRINVGGVCGPTFPVRHQTGGLVHLTALLVTSRMLSLVLILWKYFVAVSDNGETQ